MTIRIGNGFDAHQIKKGDGMILGGVYIACEYSIIAHSDGDIISHSVCDALLGAASLGDIGKFFPNTDEFKNISCKATTTDKMGFMGKKEGISCLTNVLIDKSAK